MWESIVVSIVMMIVSAVIQSATAKKVTNKDPEAGSLDTPTAEEGGTIPVVFGTCIVKQSNVTWYGDSRTEPIKSSGGGKK